MDDKRSFPTLTNQLDEEDGLKIMEWIFLNLKSYCPFNSNFIVDFHALIVFS